MRIIDENGRLFGKISVIDLLVIAVVLVLALALCVKNARLGADKEEKSDKPMQDITLQVRAEAQRRYIYESLHVGDEIWDQDHFDWETPLGVIADIEVTSDPGTTFSSMNDGTVERVEVEDTVDLLVTIQCTGVVEDRTYSINGDYDVGINSNRNYSTRLSKFTGMVADVH